MPNLAGGGCLLFKRPLNALSLRHNFQPLSQLGRTSECLLAYGSVACLGSVNCLGNTIELLVGWLADIEKNRWLLSHLAVAGAVASQVLVPYLIP